MKFSIAVQNELWVLWKGKISSFAWMKNDELFCRSLSVIMMKVCQGTSNESTFNLFANQTWNSRSTNDGTCSKARKNDSWEMHKQPRNKNSVWRVRYSMWKVKRLALTCMLAAEYDVQYLFSYRRICIFHLKQSRFMYGEINQWLSLGLGIFILSFSLSCSDSTADWTRCCCDVHWNDRVEFARRNDEKMCPSCASWWMPLHQTSDDDVCNNKNLSREREMQWCWQTCLIQRFSHLRQKCTLCIVCKYLRQTKQQQF